MYVEMLPLLSGGIGGGGADAAPVADCGLSKVLVSFRMDLERRRFGRSCLRKVTWLGCRETASSVSEYSGAGATVGGLRIPRSGIRSFLSMGVSVSSQALVWVSMKDP